MSHEIYMKNIVPLRKRFERYADLLENTEDDFAALDEEKSLIVGVENVCGKKVLYVQRDGETYQLDSLYDSDSILDAWFEGLEDTWNLGAKIFMYGFGNGMYVRKFLERAREDCAIVVHEPSIRIFRKVLNEFDISDILENKRVFFTLWPGEKDKIMSEYYRDTIEYSDVDASKGANYLNYSRIFTNDCVKFVGAISSAKNVALDDRIVIERFGGYFLNNSFKNMKFLADSKSLPILADRIPKGMPAIVVAAGPSLDKNIMEIKRAKGKALIISTDTALRPLCNNGIIPDIGIIVDGKKDARYMSNEMAQEVPLICSIKSGNDFLSIHRGNKYFVDDSITTHIEKFFDSIGKVFPVLECGGSVATACFDLARQVEAKCIILVGQDLAYTGDKTHSVDTVRGEKPTAVEDLEHPVMSVDIYGNPIRTSREFETYREWFESQIIKYPTLNVIDATEGGMKIEGTEIMALRDAIDMYCIKEYEVSSMFADAEPFFSDEQRKQFVEFVRKIPKDLEDMKIFVRQILEDYSEMRQLVESNHYKSVKMKQIYEKCNRNTELLDENQLMEYVQLSLKDKTSKLLTEVNKLEQDEKTELLTACKLGEQYLKDILEAITDVQSYADIINIDFPKESEH